MHTRRHLGVPRMMRRLALLPIFVAAAASARAQSYDINVILPLSGPGAYGGQTHQKGLQILEGVENKAGGINGRPVHFVFFDDQSSPQVAVQLSTTLAAQNVPVVLGSDLSAMCRAMAPIFANGPVQYCISPAIHPPKDSYTFSGNIDSKDLLAANLHFIRDKGWNRIAMLSTTDASGQDNDAGYYADMKLPENKNLTLVDAEHFNPTDINVGAQLTRINAAHPQVLIISVPGAPFATALRGMSAADMLDLPVVSTSANMVTSQLEEYKPFIPKNLYFAGFGYAVGMARDDRGLQAVHTFADALKAAGITMDVQVGLPWDPGAIVIDALRHLGTNASAKQVRDYIEGLHDYPGIIGLYDFRDGSQRGLTMADAIMVRWDGATSSWSAASKFGGGLQ
jgi:branched-chain amino acid transport system substrate-binding protein